MDTSNVTNALVKSHVYQTTGWLLAVTFALTLNVFYCEGCVEEGYIIVCKRPLDHCNGRVSMILQFFELKLQDLDMLNITTIS